MSFESDSGRRLYALLPEVYRSRDNTVRDSSGTIIAEGDQARYLDACGQLLDNIKATLDQQLADCFPDIPADGEMACQDWLLPYFADLLGVRLVSPNADGQRHEIANAMAWRKGKGTLRVAHAIVESIGGFESVIQEAWQRVAITPRIGMSMRPSATIDFRVASRAVQAEAGSPSTQATNFNNDGAIYWKQSNAHGIPCFQGSFDDVSRRTVDLRSTDWQQGHIHPKRLLIYMPTPSGLHSNETGMNWQQSLCKQNGQTDVWEFGDVDGVMKIISSTVNLEQGKAYRFVNVQFCCQINVPKNSSIELVQSVIRNVVIEHDDCKTPVLKATDCLFRELHAEKGLCRMEYCTVLGETECKHLLASDSIFAGDIKGIKRPNVPLGSKPDFGNCIRYSRVPVSLAQGIASKQNCTEMKPLFFSDAFNSPKIEAGCAVLHPASSEEICFGAEDGGEMGVYHHKHYCLRNRAVIDKLQDYMPVGIEPVLIPDDRLLCKPPAAKNTGNEGVD